MKLKNQLKPIGLFLTLLLVLRPTTSIAQNQLSTSDIERHASALLLGTAPLLNDANILAYVNRVGRWLSLQTDHADTSWSFGVLDSPTVASFSAPGNTVVVTSGLLELLRNETELAAILSHEIAHLINGDHAITKLPPHAVDSLPHLTQHLRTAYTKGVSSESEYRADQLAVIIAARGGYDPYGLPTVLQVFDAASANDPIFALTRKTHPAPADRLARLLAAMPNISNPAGGGGLNSSFSANAGRNQAATPVANISPSRAALSAPPKSSTPSAHIQASPASLTSALPSGQSLIVKIQELLAKQGFDPGSTSGNISPDFEFAIMEYQNEHGLAITGQADQPLLGHLLAQ